MSLMDFNKQLKALNTHFASKGIKLRIEPRGNRLGLRGPLPCNGSPEKSKSQRISLGLPFNAEGLAQAEKSVQLISLQLEHQQFNWDAWLSKKPRNNTKENNIMIKEGIKKFELHFFKPSKKGKSLASANTNWNSAYKPYLRRLEKQAKKKDYNHKKDLFIETLLSYSENTRSRLQCGTVLQSFAKYLNISLPEDWKEKACGYGLHKAQFRDLPNDNLIIQTFNKIPNAKWKLVFGLMATYGLRNHEVFFCDFSSLTKKRDKVLRVLPNTKTGEHQSWPFHPDWVEKFDLFKLGEDENSLPNVNRSLDTTTLQKVGRRVSEQFHRYKIPFTPYDLRHAWAIRTIHMGLPDTVSARMMGHSVAIHTRTYHHWITKRDQQKAVDDALSKTLYK